MQISNIEILKELKDRGVLKRLIASGIVPVKVALHIDIYWHVDAQRQSGIKRKRSVENTANAFGVCNATVYNALNSLK